MLGRAGFVFFMKLISNTSTSHSFGRAHKSGGLVGRVVIIGPRNIVGSGRAAGTAHDSTFGNVGKLALPARRGAACASRVVCFTTASERRHKVAKQFSGVGAAVLWQLCCHSYGHLQSGVRKLVGWNVGTAQ